MAVQISLGYLVFFCILISSRRRLKISDLEYLTLADISDPAGYHFIKRRTRIIIIYQFLKETLSMEIQIRLKNDRIGLVITQVIICYID